MECLIIIGDSRDYHAVDWFSVISDHDLFDRTLFATDIVRAEGREQLRDGLDVIELWIIDGLLFRTQSRYGDLWRNLVKFVVSPIQAYRIKQLGKKYPEAVFHAHSIYYLFICAMAGICYIGTPQGSELLVRPHRSLLYQWLCRYAIDRAKMISVDSRKMKNAADAYRQGPTLIIQNGVDTAAILAASAKVKERHRIVSIRGMTDLYRIGCIVDARNSDRPNIPLEFVYPFMDENYRKKVTGRTQPGDLDHGSLPKARFMQLLAESLMVISIPSSDSSPRSVYESIFAGAIVATVEDLWQMDVPECMQRRLIVVDVKNDPRWFHGAYEAAKEMSKDPYLPSREAILAFDMEMSIRSQAKRLYAS